MSDRAFDNLASMFARSVKHHAAQPLFGVPRPNGWRWYSYAEVGELVDACRGGLAAAGVGHGDRVGLISTNSVWWAVTTYACYGLGAVIARRFADQGAEVVLGDVRDCTDLADELRGLAVQVGDAEGGSPCKLEMPRGMALQVGVGEEGYYRDVIN